MIVTVFPLSDVKVCSRSPMARTTFGVVNGIIAANVSESSKWGFGVAGAACAGSSTAGSSRAAGDAEPSWQDTSKANPASNFARP
jgi:hypothetical protein